MCRRPIVPDDEIKPKYFVASKMSFIYCMPHNSEQLYDKSVVVSVGVGYSS